jgi:hypothetical protein
LRREQLTLSDCHIWSQHHSQNDEVNLQEYSMRVNESVFTSVLASLFESMLVPAIHSGAIARRNALNSTEIAINSLEINELARTDQGSNPTSSSELVRVD